MIPGYFQKNGIFHCFSIVVLSLSEGFVQKIFNIIVNKLKVQLIHRLGAPS